MTETITPGTRTDNNEAQKQPSDARIILGPLVKYAAMGLVLVSIIITTAVMLDRQFNTIDEEVAILQAQLAEANKASAADTSVAVEEQAEAATADAAASTRQAPAPAPVPVTRPVTAVQTTEVPAQKTVTVAAEATQSPVQAIKADTVTITATEAATDTSAVAKDAIAEQADAHYDVFDQSIDDMIAERNDYLKEMDRIYLEEYKASQQKQLQLMRERLARQEKHIQEMEKRYQEIYDVRATNVKERQQRRDSFLSDRI